MKQLFEQFGLFVGALGVSILILSVSHEYGYFYSIGGNFQAMLSTSDYLGNAILWLPLGLGFAYLWIDFGLLREKTSAEKTNWKKWSSWILPAIVIGNFTVNFLLPFTFFTPIMLLVVFVYVWHLIWQFYLPSVGQDDPDLAKLVRAMVRLGPPVMLAMFVHGWWSADFDVKRFDDPYIFKIRDETEEKSRIFLRSLDKGVLLNNPIAKRVEFYRWEQIELIGKPKGNEPRGLACYFFRVGCRENPIIP